MNIAALDRADAASRIALSACVIAAVGIALGSAGTQPAAETISLAGWAVAIVAAAAVDSRFGRLPDALVVPGVLFTMASAAFAGRAAEALVGATLLCLPMLLIHLARPAGLGFGDVKFGLLLGAGIGVLAPALVLPAFLLAAALHLAVCLAAEARGRLVPFGPALALGSAVVVAATLWSFQ